MVDSGRIDAARPLWRTAAVAAALAAGVVALVTALVLALVGLTGEAERARRAYVPVTLAGEAVVSWDFGGPVDAGKVEAGAAGLAVTANLVPDGYGPAGAESAAGHLTPFVDVIAPGCTPFATVLDRMGTTRADDFGGTPPCRIRGIEDGFGVTVLLQPADEVVRRLGLDDRAARVLRAGGAVVRGDHVLAGQRQVRLARGTSVVDPLVQETLGPEVEVDQDVTVPLVRVPESPESEGAMLGAHLVLATGTPTTRTWAVEPLSMTVRDPSGAGITKRAAERLQERLGDDAYVYVERGFRPEDRILVAVLVIWLAGVLVTVAVGAWFALRRWLRPAYGKPVG